MKRKYETDGIFYVLGNDEDKLDHDVLFAELKKLGYEGRTIHPNRVTSEFSPEGAKFFVDGDEIRPAAVLGWVFEDILIPGMYLLTAFERSGIPVVNTAQTLFCGQNKYLNSEALHRNGVLHLSVLSGFSDADVDRWIPQLEFPLVLKPIVGVGGQSVVKVETPEAFRMVATVLAGYRSNYYVQPYVEKPGRDIRVTCVNYKAVYAYYKYSPEGSWITNVVAGGKPELIELTPELAEVAESASRAMNALISGVDILEDSRDNSYKVLEVNTCPTSVKSSTMMNTEPVTQQHLAAFLIEFARERGTIAPAFEKTI